MRFRSKTILAYIPRHQDGEIILNQALYYQQALGMRIFVLNILKVFSVLPLKFRIKKAQKIKNNALQELDVFVKNTLHKEIPEDVILRIKFGNTVKTIINESKKGGYEFILLDKSRGMYKGALTKRQVNKIISHSYCPVLSINRDFPIQNVKKIIIPVDISQTTKKRLLWATMFAKKFNAKIQIVSALTVNIDEKKSLAYRNAERIKQMLTDRGVECDVKIIKVKNQEIYDVILNYIKEENPDMVIIRTHQESVFQGSQIGKFVSEIIHGCTMPVFTVGDSKQFFPTDFEEYISSSLP